MKSQRKKALKETIKSRRKKPIERKQNALKENDVLNKNEMLKEQSFKASCNFPRVQRHYVTPYVCAAIK